LGEDNQLQKGLDICITDNLAEHGEAAFFFRVGSERDLEWPTLSGLNEEFVDMYNYGPGIHTTFPCSTHL
jgi:hypothetical protein